MFLPEQAATFSQFALISRVFVVLHLISHLSGFQRCHFNDHHLQFDLFICLPAICRNTYASKHAKTSAVATKIMLQYRCDLVSKFVSKQKKIQQFI